MPILVEFFFIIMWTYQFWLNNKFVLQECLCLPIWRVSYARVSRNKFWIRIVWPSRVFLAKVCNLIFSLVSPVPSAADDLRGVAAGGAQPAQQRGGVGSLRGKAKGWTT
jgi:hypothetical protein